MTESRSIHQSQSESHVVLTTVDNQTYRGILVAKDENIGKIVLNKVTINNAKLSGLHNFYASNIQELAFTKSCAVPELDQTITRNYKQDKRRSALHYRKDTPKHLTLLSGMTFDSDQLIRSPCHCAGDNDSGDQGIGSAEEWENFEDYYEMENFILFCRTCDKFQDSISHVMTQDVIAVAFFGEAIGREGTLSFMQVATKTGIFIYDILRLGMEGFVDGLQAVLESSDVLKVIHDSRMISDLLYHQYGVTLSNVFDTQVAAVFVFRLINGGEWPRFVDSLPSILIAYLNMDNDDVYHFFVREQSKQKDEEVWLHRPLCHQLMRDTLKNLKHMIPLYHSLLDKMEMEFNMGMQLYLDHARNAPHDVADKFRLSSHLLPFAFQDLSKMAANSVRESMRSVFRKTQGVSHDSNGFVEMCSIRGDKMVMTSRDSMWKKKTLFSPATKCDSKDKDRQNSSSPPISAETNSPLHSNISLTAHGGYQSHDLSIGHSEINFAYKKTLDMHEEIDSQEPVTPVMPSACRVISTLSSQPPSREQINSSSASKLSDRLSVIQIEEKSPPPSAVERSALMRLMPSSPSTSSNEILSDSEIVDLRQSTIPPPQDVWDVDRVLEFEMAQRILKQARLEHNKSQAKKRLLPPKTKSFRKQVD